MFSAAATERSTVKMQVTTLKLCVCVTVCGQYGSMFHHESTTPPYITELTYTWHHGMFQPIGLPSNTKL